MEINRNNIGQYIDFLHKRKTGNAASNDLISKWQQLPDHEIGEKLKQLYNHWGISETQGVAYEQDFIKMHHRPQNPPPPNYYQKPPQSPPTPSPYTNPYPSQLAPKSSNSLLYVLLALIIITGGVVAALLFINRENKVEENSILTAEEMTRPEVTSPTLSVDEIAAKEAAKQAAKDSATNETNDREAVKAERIRTIRALVFAEENREMDIILSSFANNMTQYWDLKNPSKDQLRDAYYNTWSKTGRQSFDNVNIKQVSENTFDLYADYSYYSIKDDANKEIPVRTRYVFNEDNEIVSTFGVK